LDFIAAVVSRIAPNVAGADFKLDRREHVSEEELIALYQSSTALVLTSEQEGLGIAAMEAMACGLPVISTRCGGPESFIVDNETGFFVNDNPREIAARMLELVTDGMMRKRMGEASRERIVTGFSEHVWNDEFDSILGSRTL
jgi:glycosyltransferase involved in cell wall biosynthesis